MRELCCSCSLLTVCCCHRCIFCDLVRDCCSFSSIARGNPSSRTRIAVPRAHTSHHPRLILCRARIRIAQVNPRAPTVKNRHTGLRKDSHSAFHVRLTSVCLLSKSAELPTRWSAASRHPCAGHIDSFRADPFCRPSRSIPRSESVPLLVFTSFLSAFETTAGRSKCQQCPGSFLYSIFL